MADEQKETLTGSLPTHLLANHLERLRATPGGLEAAINRRLAKKLGCAPEDVDMMLQAGEKPPA